MNITDVFVYLENMSVKPFFKLRTEIENSAICPYPAQNTTATSQELQNMSVKHFPGLRTVFENSALRPYPTQNTAVITQKPHALRKRGV